MLTRSRLLLVDDYRTCAKVSDAFSNVLHRSGWSFDHVAIDVGSLAASTSRLTRDLSGQERDREAVKIIHRQITNMLLRRISPKKSLAFFLDGSEPLWKVQHMRVHPGKRFEEKFYRSAASPMVYLLEEKLRNIATELRQGPTEFIVSGAGSPGPAEGKISAWMLDIATRIARPPTQPLHIAADVSASDSFCLIGNPDLMLAAMGATPFHHLTVLNLMQGELKSLSLHDALEWLALDHLMPASLTSSSTAGDNTSARAAQQRLAAVRTDTVLLYLLAHGMSATDLPAFSLSFADVMEAYASELASFTFTSSSDSTTKKFSGLLFDEYPLQSDSLVSAPSLRLKVEPLVRVLTKATRRPATFPPRFCKHTSNYLEISLQTHAMLCSGGIQHMGWTPPEYTASVPEKPPKIPIDQFIAHLRHVASANNSSSSSSEGEEVVVTIAPRRDRTEALTGLESLLLTSPKAELIEQVVPMYTRGHTMPDGIAKEIVETPNVYEALGKTRSVLAGAVAASQKEGEDHPAMRHYPSHFLVRTPGSRGPPHGWTYHAINVGVKSEAMSVRYAINASDSTLLTVADSAREAGLSKKNMMHVFDSASDKWVEVPCRDAATPGESELSTLRVVTWNTQFDRHSGERTPLGRDGIDWCTTTRYMALAKVLSQCDADIIAMQEVEPAWAEYLSQQPWVRQGYRMSCLGNGHAISPWGVLMLIRNTVDVVGFDHANVPAFSGHTSAMPEAILHVSKSQPLVTICSMHLLAPYNQNNVNNRDTQLSNLIKRLEHHNSKAAGSTVVMGDFNDYPTKFFRLPAELSYRDAWETIHPECARLATLPVASALSESDQDARGFTIDGVANPYAGKIIEQEFFGRADRVMFNAKHLQPIHAELIGKESVRAVLQKDGGDVPLKLVHRPGDDIPEYLHPSDHFGVLVEFQVM